MSKEALHKYIMSLGNKALWSYDWQKPSFCMSDSLVIEKVLECADSIHLDMLFNIFPSGIIKDVMELQMMIGSKYDHRLSMILKKYYDIDDPKAYLDDFRSNKRQELIKRGSKPNKRRL